MSERKKVDYYEVALKGPSSLLGADAIARRCLEVIGIKPGQIIHCDNGFIFTVATYLKSFRQAQDIKSKLRRLKLKKVAVHIKTLSKKDWRDQWKETFHTFSLTKNIDVIPIWEKKRYRNRRKIPIVLDPGNAFGTGLHETTRFMVELIEQCRGQFKDFLDLGSGTGILAIAAHRLGATKVEAIDSNRDCSNITQKNLQINDCANSQSRSMDLTRWITRKHFDFVAANLITHELIRLKKKIVSLVRPGQFLAVSGVACENLDIFKKAYRGLPVRTVRILQGKQWAAILFRKNKKAR
ncbi:MAG: 50S ribosomal protein L11 methyltransferase [Candidatus Omnitrophota bacterium]